MQTTTHKDYREHILALAQITPVQPVQIAKELNTNSIIASAMLSEMTAKGLLLISHLKIGSSPLYYLPTNPEKLLNYTIHLNEKDQKVLEHLHQEKILRDTTLDPLSRVALRQNLKDFAKPLTVTYKETQELFWKYYLTQDNDAETIIKNQLEKTTTEIQTTQPPLQQTTTQTTTSQQTQTPIQQTPEIQKEPLKKEIKKTEPKPPRKTTPQKNTTIQENLTANSPLTSTPITDSFAHELNRNLTKKNITLNSHTIIKKNAEFEGTLSMETPLGTITFYCRATTKKRITDTDLTNAYVQGQLKKLPTIYLHKGELTTKAKTLLTNLTGITITRI